MTPKNVAELRALISTLDHQDSKVFSLPETADPTKAMDILRQAVQAHDVSQVRTHRDEGLVESWYHGRTKYKQKDIVIMAAVDTEQKKAQVTVHCDLSEMTTGLLAEIGREFGDELEKQLGARVVHISIKDSVVYKSSLF